MPETDAPAKGGRPSSFKPEYIEQSRKLAMLGATDREVAEFFEVSESTLNLWKHQHPEFSESLKLGKAASDNRVEQSLYRRATGYSYDAVKIMGYEGVYTPVPYVEHIPPDTTACIFWLKNRRREDWRDRVDGAPRRHGFRRSVPMAVVAVILPFRRSASGAVHPAGIPASRVTDTASRSAWIARGSASPGEWAIAWGCRSFSFDPPPPE